jgi:protein tyrosine phosphatase (PTP) superfamily phosphohydrolase (DUF442 family)
MIACLAILCGVIVAAQDTPSPKVEGPFAWGGAEHVTRVGKLWFASQPDEAALEVAKKRGVRLVINLREPSEYDWPEQQAVERLGMTYRSIPVSGAEPFSRDAFERIDEQVDKHQNEEILIHCSSANRAAGWFATRLVLRDGMPVADAIEVGRRVGITNQPVVDKVREYVEREKPHQRIPAGADQK